MIPPDDARDDAGAALARLEERHRAVGKRMSELGAVEDAWLEVYGRVAACCKRERAAR